MGDHAGIFPVELGEYPSNADECKNTRRVKKTDVTSISAPITRCPVVMAVRVKDVKLFPSWNSLSHAPIPRTI